MGAQPIQRRPLPPQGLQIGDSDDDLSVAVMGAQGTVS
jgi:hypothetical protein